jgi:hypothetical protein
MGRWAEAFELSMRRGPLDLSGISDPDLLLKVRTVESLATNRRTEQRKKYERRPTTR